MLYKPTIGLEIHAELKTETKMFCNSRNDPDETRPNVNVCPVCMAHPGTLPTINKKAVEQVIRVGLALGGRIADFTEFDRKNYFYPDIPKGYQISQYEHPIVSGGELNDVAVTRVHLEEDTAISKHFTSSVNDYSLADFNRAGVPLMELVTEPVIKSAKEAAAFAKELQLIMRYLGVADANMEKGQMRVEVNVSVLRSDLEDSKGRTLGTKVEIKNLNSFRSVERAIEYEIKRMTDLLEKGEENKIVQETRGWDEGGQKTFSQRSKEYSHDYRYFPEPDLPKMYLHEAFNIEKMKKELPELPWQKRARYKKDFGIKDEDIESFVADPALAEFFEDVAEKLRNREKIKLAANYLTSDFLGLRARDPNIRLPEAGHFVELIEMLAAGELSSRAGKDILAMMVVDDHPPRRLAEEKGLLQKSDKVELKKIAEKIVAKNPEVVADYRAGKETALQFLVGLIMKETKGSANPRIVGELLKEILQ